MTQPRQHIEHKRTVNLPAEQKALAMPPEVDIAEQTSVVPFIKTLMPTTPDDRVESLGKYLSIIAQGKKHREAEEATSLPYSVISSFKGNYPRFKLLYELCRDRGEEVRQTRREDALYKRGVEGWKEPIFSKGELVGEREVYSDKCLEIGLRAHDPQKFGDKQTVEHTGQSLVYHIYGVDANAPKPPIDVTAESKVE